jgi:hypothetical protein
MLGDRRVKTRRVFNRPAALKGSIRLDINYWNWLIDESGKALKVNHIRSSRVWIDDELKCPSLRLYNRPYVRTNKRTGERIREDQLFEMIDVGTALTFQVMAVESEGPEEESNQTPIEVEDLKRVFSVIGSNLGISPWGSKFGYGRYKLIDMEEL